MRPVHPGELLLEDCIEPMGFSARCVDGPARRRDRGGQGDRQGDPASHACDPSMKASAELRLGFQPG
jgi:hypothetical protein